MQKYNDMNDERMILLLTTPGIQSPDLMGSNSHGYWGDKAMRQAGFDLTAKHMQGPHVPVASPPRYRSRHLATHSQLSKIIPTFESVESLKKTDITQLGL